MNSRRAAVVTTTFIGCGAMAAATPPNATDPGWRDGYYHRPNVLFYSAPPMIYPPIGFYQLPAAAFTCCSRFVSH
jgi:hypothetical protein